jgi:hypothetical protein
MIQSFNEDSLMFSLRTQDLKDAFKLPPITIDFFSK